MPRKNARPAARKMAARKKAKMEARSKQQRRTWGASARGSAATGVLLAAVAAGILDNRSNRTGD